MSEHGEHKARKRFGQNFLVDETVIARIARAVSAKKQDNLVEIGPGQGALTAYLLEDCPNLSAVELDRDLVPLLQAKFALHPHFTLYQADALQFDFASLATNRPCRIVGNLPYNISTPLIFHLMEARAHIADMHFMLQKEVVDRLAAPPGEKAYGRLSVLCQYYCQIEPLFVVPPEAFRPIPKVDSAIVRLTPHTTLPHPADDVAVFTQVVKAVFQMRRKTLRNGLKALLGTDPLTQIQSTDLSLRPEALSLEDFVHLANEIKTLDVL